jgi:hypothetical protein
VTEDVEARLRAALQAHADLVEDLADRALPPPRPATATRRWRGSVLVAAAAAAVVAGAVWFGGGGSTEPDHTAAPSSDGPVEATAPSDGPSVQSAPEAGGQPFDLYTHCGVRGADIGGVWFVAEPPLTDGEGNPPDGWGNPYQPGTLTLLSPTDAVFRDDAGHEVQLHADEAARPAPCE